MPVHAMERSETAQFLTALASARTQHVNCSADACFELERVPCEERQDFSLTNASVSYEMSGSS